MITKLKLKTYTVLHEKRIIMTTKLKLKTYTVLHEKHTMTTCKVTQKRGCTFWKVE